MSNSNDELISSDNSRNLKDALALVKNREADRDDVVVDMKAAERTRLELLADELRPVIEDIDETDERFDFGLSVGERSRLWIDMTSFVAMGHDKRSYRFLKDTRMGRIVLAETSDMNKAADIVSEYIAEKVLERERMLEGEWIALKNGKTLARDADTNGAPKPSRWRAVFWFLFGALCCVAALVAATLVFAPDAI